jgi:hypothetical protein
VVFNLSTWPVRRLNLTDWLIEELHTSYNVPRRIGSLWLASRDILPLLDGLDEVAEPYRAQCVETINHFMREYGLIRVAVCCRTAEYYSLTRALLAEEVLERWRWSSGCSEGTSTGPRVVGADPIASCSKYRGADLQWQACRCVTRPRQQGGAPCPAFRGVHKAHA